MYDYSGFCLLYVPQKKNQVGVVSSKVIVDMTRILFFRERESAFTEFFLLTPFYPPPLKK